MNKHTQRSLLFDRLFKMLIHFSGAWVIVCVLAIGFYIFYITLPLFQSARITPSQTSNTEVENRAVPAEKFILKKNPQQLNFVNVTNETNFLGQVTQDRQEYSLDISHFPAIRLITSGNMLNNAYLLDEKNVLYGVEWYNDKLQIRYQRAFSFEKTIETMSLLLGDRSLLVADRQGAIIVLNQKLQVQSQFNVLGKIQQIIPSPHDKSFWVLQNNALDLFHLTSRRHLLHYEISQAPQGAKFITKGKQLQVTLVDGSQLVYEISNPHPEVSIHSLFSAVSYEGYEEPLYIWQSSASSDDFEAKLSLIPLIFGTFKGTFFAMIITIPLSLLAAFYVGYFSNDRLKRWVKPAIELMASIPSVVIGFMAALWLAPIIEKHLLTRGLQQWLFESWNVTIDQRNSVVVAFALSFAVIPLVFSLSEDAISNIPHRLTAASLALGASRWQAFRSVILPSASPAIFAAIMIGVGRAIGETMIVLMATGNTPLMSFSPFNGMRTLSANIAVEIPEAAVNSTLYRVLFLSAVILFVINFVINTLAEIIRNRLRRKYATL